MTQTAIGLYYAEDDWAEPILVGLFESRVASLFGEWAFSLQQKKKEIAYDDDMRELLSPPEFEEYMSTRGASALGKPSFHRKVLSIQTDAVAKAHFHAEIRKP